MSDVELPPQLVTALCPMNKREKERKKVKERRKGEKERGERKRKRWIVCMRMHGLCRHDKLHIYSRGK